MNLKVYEMYSSTYAVGQFSSVSDAENLFHNKPIREPTEEEIG